MELILLLIMFGGVFITSEHFINIENDAKTYLIGISVVLLLLVCSVNRKGLSVLKKALRFPNISIGLTVICLILSVYGILQYTHFVPSRHYAFHITGTYENPAGFAAVQATLFPFILILCFCKEKNRLIQLFAGLTIIACTLTIILSGSRSGLLAIVVASTIVFAFKTNTYISLQTHKWPWVILIIVTIIFFILLYLVKPDSAKGRLFIWSICLDMIKQRPFLGYGIGGIERFYMDAQAAYFCKSPDSPYIMLADNVIHPFNEYIKLTVNYGLLGLTIAIIILVLIIKRLLKSGENVKITGLSIVSSVFVMCQFSYPFHYAAVWFISVIAIIPAFINNHEYKMVWITPMYLRISLPIVFSLLLAIILRMMYFDLKWAEMSKRSLSGQTERMLPHYEKMKPIMKHNSLFLYNYAAELNYIGRYEESLAITEECQHGWNDYDVQMLLADNYENTGLFDLAISTYQHAFEMIPSRFEPLNCMMNIYLNNGDSLNANKVANMIINKPIKVESMRVKQIKSEALQFVQKNN